ncbi:FadR/GntR family transcriptional regulator [Thalassotalea psychrophila]|uniref:FadR/GntR family transcriptional regulator n=1 Tax=Thalassotalea psychrophila TaxID=3065647 RepID=A0ABY9TYQ9_9GAMM|nr:FadR/GntR family transcriptional regulator [Colwelliaceae bacterium SQ149]
MGQTQTENNKRKDNLVDHAMDRIIDFIKKNQLKVGNKLPSESYFIELLNVSRTVVREAFKSLNAMSIIKMSAGKKAEVGEFDDYVIGIMLSHALRTEQINVQQIWDARRAIEIRTAELAAIHHTEQQANQITTIVKNMRLNVSNLEQMTKYDIEFHKLIAQASKNPILPVLVGSLSNAINETNPVLWRVRTTKEQQSSVVKLHETIADAIIKSDPDAAKQAMEDHFDNASAWLLKAGFN